MMTVKPSKKTKTSNYLLVANIAVLIFSIISFLFLLPPEIPLFYGAPIGEAQLAKSFLFPVPSIISLLVFSINFIVSKAVVSDFIKKALNSASIFVFILSAITLIKIFFLVGYI